MAINGGREKGKQEGREMATAVSAWASSAGRWGRGVIPTL
jgi:hypothetical protein